MRQFILFLSLALIFILTGCGSDNKVEGNQQELKVLEVQLELPTDKVNPDEEVSIKAIVTYGDEKVENADEVKFQIWEPGKEDEEENIIADHQGDGVYSIKKSFDHDGVYYIIAHVTAKDMHTMPRKELIVGNATAPDNHNSGDEHDHSDEHHGDHDNSDKK